MLVLNFVVAVSWRAQAALFGWRLDLSTAKPRCDFASGRHDRRSFLKSVGRTGLAATAWPAVAFFGGTGAVQSRADDKRARRPLIQPTEIRSEGGVLRATLTAAPGRVQLGNFALSGLLYNGSYIPPLLRARLGDTLRITLKNDLPDQPTNLHYHGMSVSPQGNSDNVFIHVHPGEQFDYEVRIPVNGRQGPGLFWYHPHGHGFVDEQVEGGMSGALVIDGIDQLYPILHGLPERFFLIKDPIQESDQQVITVNGRINPAAQIRPGEMQFWRIANIGGEYFVKFRIEGMPLYVVATDGHPLSRPRKMTEFFLGPGQRIDTIAIGPPPGEYAMRTISYQNPAWKKPDPASRWQRFFGRSRVFARMPNLRFCSQHLGPAWIDEVRAGPDRPAPHTDLFKVA